MASQLNENSNVNELWTTYKDDHKKTYDTEEENKRFDIFTENVKKIIEHNQKFAKGEVTYEMGINKFTDMTNDERKQFTGGLRKPE